MLQYHELESDDLKEAWKYYSFIAWCIEEGWQPYVDGERIWINLGLPGRPIKHVKTLWFEYFKQLPESIKDRV